MLPAYINFFGMFWLCFYGKSSVIAGFGIYMTAYQFFYMVFVNIVSETSNILMAKNNRSNLDDKKQKPFLKTDPDEEAYHEPETTQKPLVDEMHQKYSLTRNIYFKGMITCYVIAFFGIAMFC